MLNQSGFNISYMIKRKTILIIACLVVLVGGGLLVIHHESSTKTQQAAIKSAQISSSKGLAGAASFTQHVYNTYLPVWAEGQRAFISSHQVWFTKSFLAHSINAAKTSSQAVSSNNGEFLFCSPLAHAPSSFKVTPSTFSATTSSATVYANGLYGSKSELVNLPVLLKDVGGKWAINSISCSLS